MLRMLGVKVEDAILMPSRSDKTGNGIGTGSSILSILNPMPALLATGVLLAVTW